jgi:hypothetical protein
MAARIAGESSVPPDRTSHVFVRGDDGGMGFHGCFGAKRIAGAACPWFSVSASAKALKARRAMQRAIWI